MDERRDSFPPAVGGSSLLVIFAVLCLTVFALLGLATVQANSRLSDASAQTVFLYLPHLGYADAPGGGPGGRKRLYRFALAGGVHCGLAGGRGFGSLGRRVLKRMRRKQQWNWWNI